MRKVLGDGQDGARYITNVPGRGYSFVAPVHRRAGSPASTPSVPASSAGRQALPPRLARIVGRDDTIAAVASLLLERRFVSVFGAGGMGKTTVAIAVAHTLSSRFEDAVYFVDLSTVQEEALVASAAASAIGCFVQAQDPMQALLAFVAGKRMLIVLDNCEHVIGATAAVAERLFKEAPQVHLLTTTREVLRVQGENVYQLLPLQSPDDSALTAEDVLKSPAVQLFMERAAASGHGMELSDDDAAIVARICNRLDGIALAIELAASRVGAFGIRGTIDLLDNRFGLQWQGRRTALPRHQTLQGLLDWSFNLLSDHEQDTLARLSVFVGNFTLDGALAVAANSDDEKPEVANSVGSLVTKSLIWISQRKGAVQYRLLETTRAYAAKKLAESGEAHGFARRLALYCIRCLHSEMREAGAFPGRDLWLRSIDIGNIRAALEWSFAEAGDIAIGTELAARSTPLFLSLSLLRECERWCERALSVLHESDRGTEREAALLEGMAISAMFTRGNGDDVREAIDRGLKLAEALGNRQRQLHLLAGLNIFATRIGDFEGALEVAERSVRVAEEAGDPAGAVMAEWMVGVSQHLVGDQAAAQRHCERGLEMAASSGRVDVDFFGYDHRVRALVALARALWLRGLPERAVKVAHQVVEEACARNHPIDVCIAYIYTIPVFLWIGDLSAAEDRIKRLLAHATKYSLAPYRAVGLALQGELLIQSGKTAAGVQLLQEALAILHAERHHILAKSFARALAEGLAKAGQFDEAMAKIRGALAAAEAGGGTFELPDLLRAQAQIC